MVISLNCTKALTVSNYNELAKIVNKHKQGKDAGKALMTPSNTSKQHALEQRIEKLRQAEAMIRGEQVCSKDNCSAVEYANTEQAKIEAAGSSNFAEIAKLQAQQ